MPCDCGHVHKDHGLSNCPHSQEKSIGRQPKVSISSFPNWLSRMWSPFSLWSYFVWISIDCDNWLMMLANQSFELFGKEREITMCVDFVKCHCLNGVIEWNILVTILRSELLWVQLQRTNSFEGRTKCCKERMMFHRLSKLSSWLVKLCAVNGKRSRGN